jgi:phosphatidylinositol alpha-1,6-mannosyltransferase
VGSTVKHLLVTNDFPPKLGGIQSYLWELWRRLPPSAFTVLTTPHPDAAAFDADQPFRVVRAPDPVLLPHPLLARRIDALAEESGAELVVLDPALPVGLLGPHLARPYGVVLHGAEITVPGRLPVANRLLRRVLKGAELVVAAGHYPAAEGERAAGRTLSAVHIPPGVDVERFRPLDADERRSARRRLGLPDGRLVLSLSRLVPRKGMDVVIRAVARLVPGRPDVHLAVAGEGRDRGRLERLARDAGAPVTFCGRVDDDALPALYGCADTFAMLCRTRWGGLEQEGFGIVFLEAAAAGLPAVAGESGGAAEAVVDGTTGLVVDPPTSVEAAAHALARLLDDDDRRRRMGSAARERAVVEFAYEVLAHRLQEALDA